MRITVRRLTFALFLVLASVPARGALLDTSAYLANPSFSNPFDATSFVANPSFESPALTLYTDEKQDRCNYQTTVPSDWSGGWTDTGTNTSTYHYRPGVYGLKSNGGYFWDPTDGVNGAALILLLLCLFLFTLAFVIKKRLTYLAFYRP